MPRLDHRSPTDIRPPFAALGVLAKSDGSARFAFSSASSVSIKQPYESSSSACIAAVNGPMDVRSRPRDDRLDRASIDLSFCDLDGSANPATAQRAALLRKILSHHILTAIHPRSLITVQIQALSQSPSLSSALNAATLALLDAGIPMDDFIVGVDIAIVPALPSDTQNSTPKTTIILDPSTSELKTANSSHFFAFSSKGSIVGNESRGIFSDSNYFSALELAQKASVPITAFIRHTVQQKIQREIHS